MNIEEIQRRIAEFGTDGARRKMKERVLRHTYG